MASIYPPPAENQAEKVPDPYFLTVGGLRYLGMASIYLPPAENQAEKVPDPYFPRKGS
jgi:hypothetical protein